MEKKLFSYNISDRGEKMVGVVLAKNIDEAEKTVFANFGLSERADATFEEVQLDNGDIFEIYYGC